MRSFLFLEEFAELWSEDRGELLEETRAEILKMFWEGRFERMGRRHEPGTILAVREENRANFPDQYFDGMPFGREEFLVQVFLTGPASLPEWKHWSPVIWKLSHKHDRGGLGFKMRYLHANDPALLSEGYLTLKDCPFEKYDAVAQSYLRSLGFPLEMLARYFADRARNRPAFLVKAQDRFTVMQQGQAAKRGRPSYEFDEGALKKWMSSLVDRLGSDGKSLGADEAHARAKVEFHPRVPRSLIRNLHRVLAPDHWRKRGRKRTPKP